MEAALAAVDTRVDALERQLNEKFPPLVDSINAVTPKIVALEQEITAHIAAFNGIRGNACHRLICFTA